MNVKIENICTDRKLVPEEFTKSLPLPSKNIASITDWVYEKIYSVPYVSDQSGINSKGIARSYHGLQHVSRVALYITVLANLYSRYQNIILEKDDLYLLQIAALFHDSARKGEERDEWDEESATLLYGFLVNRLEVPSIKAKIIAEAVANKDTKTTQVYKELNTETGIWFKSGKRVKNIYQCLIHDADCLDIIRARASFDANYLDFYQKIAQFDEIAFEEMAQFIVEARSLIAYHGDSRAKMNLKVKKTFECVGIYQKNLDLIQDKKTIFPIIYPLHKNLLEKELLSSQTLLTTPIFNEEKGLTDDNIQAALKEGKLLVRGVGSPSAKLNKHQNNYAEQEIYKMRRRPNVRTRAKIENKQLGKNGNPNRSTTLLITGSCTYASVGFLILNPKHKHISSISDIDSDTGRGKKKIEYSKIETSEKEKQIKQLIKNQKMGGKARNNHALMIYNEITYRIKKVDAIYFTRDPVLYNKIGGFIDNPERAILEAIFLQQTYFKQTGTKLPIYEYSGVHGFCKKAAEYHDEEILSIWQNLAKRYFEAHIEETYSQNDIKVSLLYGYGRTATGVPPYGTIGSLDEHYSNDLKNNIQIRIEKEKRDVLEAAVQHYIELIKKGEKKVLDETIFSMLMNIPKNVPEIIRHIHDEITRDLNQYLMEQFEKDRNTFNKNYFWRLLDKPTSHREIENIVYDDIPLLKPYLLAQLTNNIPIIHEINQFIYQTLKNFFEELDRHYKTNNPISYANFYKKKLKQAVAIMSLLICTNQNQALLAKVQKVFCQKMLVTKEILSSFDSRDDFLRARHALDKLGILNESHINMMREQEDDWNMGECYFNFNIETRIETRVPYPKSTWKPFPNEQIFLKKQNGIINSSFDEEQNNITYSLLLREKNNQFIQENKGIPSFHINLLKLPFTSTQKFFDIIRSNSSFSQKKLINIIGIHEKDSIHEEKLNQFMCEFTKIVVIPYYTKFRGFKFFRGGSRKQDLEAVYENYKEVFQDTKLTEEDKITKIQQKINGIRENVILSQKKELFASSLLPKLDEFIEKMTKVEILVSDTQNIIISSQRD